MLECAGGVIANCSSKYPCTLRQDRMGSVAGVGNQSKKRTILNSKPFIAHIVEPWKNYGDYD